MTNCYLGLDAGGTNLTAGVVGRDGTVLTRHSEPVGEKRMPEEITEAMYRVSDRALRAAGLSWADVPYWGIGMPSTVNARTGLLVHANCFGWRNLPIYTYLRKYTDRPIRIENDANCAALAEAMAGAGRGCSDLILLTLGTGVGGGIIADGALFTGAGGLGAEPGHTKIVKDGRLCTCGQKGCLEAYASATALVKRAAEEAGSYPGGMLDTLSRNGRLDGKGIFRAAEKGDAAAVRIVDEYAEYLAAGLSSLISIFRPERILLGGGLSGAGEPLFRRVRENLRTMTFGADEIGIPKVMGAKLGNDAGIIGAALLGADASLREPTETKMSA